MAFLDERYLLENKTAERLYQEIGELPIVDVHNHGDVKEIVDNKGWNDIWEVEAATDHYVWELMRKRGIAEQLITGDVSNREKWLALAEIFPDLAGNPTYEWIHLDLKRRFGIEQVICADTAELIWDKTKAALGEERMKPQQLLQEMKVTVMCTTDQPTSDLRYHQQASKEIKTIRILPTWRPDQAMNIEKKGWIEFVQEMGLCYEQDTTGLKGFLTALQQSHDFFEENGCVASDHGLFVPYSHYLSEEKAALIHRKAYNGNQLSPQEVKDYKAFLLEQFGQMNEKSGWVTQLHLGAVRDYRQKLFDNLGPDSGGDVSTQHIEITEKLRYFLNRFDGRLKIVLYCIDPGHYPALATISRAFPQVSLGAAWWFNDSPYGMENQLKYIGTVDLLANFAGMVTDSRKLISYGSRTEMFRRSLCNVLGNLVERGQIPAQLAADLAVKLSYEQPLNLFFKD